LRKATPASVATPFERIRTPVIVVGPAETSMMLPVPLRRSAGAVAGTSAPGSAIVAPLAAFGWIVTRPAPAP
jgi:hypothetical protein